MLLLGLFDPECADGMLGRAHTFFFSPDFERWLWGNMVQMDQIEKIPRLSLLSANGTQPLHLCLCLSDLQVLGNNRSILENVTVFRAFLVLLM